MAARKEKQRILTGGLNLVPPADKLSDGDSLLMDNWRTDQAGLLRSRKGLIINKSSIAGGVFHTIARAGDNRYLGVGSNLYWGPNAETLLDGGLDGNPLGIAFYQGATWVMNRLRRFRIKGSVKQNWGVPAPATAPTASPGAQQFITAEEWEGSPGQSPLAPGTAVGYLARTGVRSVFIANPPNPSEFESNGVTSIPAPCITYDSANRVSGSSSLKIKAIYAAPWVVSNNFLQERGVALDTRAPLADAAQDDDYFRLWVWCNDPSAVNAITVTLFSGPMPSLDTPPNPQTDIQPVVAEGPASTPEVPSTPAVVSSATQRATATLPGTVLAKAVSSASGVWTLLQVRRNVNADKLNKTIAKLSADPAASSQNLADAIDALVDRLKTAHFTAQQGGKLLTSLQPDNSGKYTVSIETTAIDWTKITGMQVLFDLKAPCQLNLDFAHFEANIANTLDGTGAYFVSFANADNQDGNLSPQSDEVTVSNQAITLHSVPVSSDPQVTQRWIWRVGFGSSQVLKIGTISDNTTGEFIDTVSVDPAQNIGVTAPEGTTSRDLPPPARGVVGPYFGKLIAYDSDAHPARYWWTNSAQPWHFPGALDEDEGNWEDAGSDDDPIIKITNRTNMLLIYKQRSLWRLIGDPVSNDPELVDDSVGLVGANAVAKAGTLGDYFEGNEGLYLRNQDFKTKISGELDPIFKGDYVQLTNGEFLPPLYKARAFLNAIEVVNDRLYFSYCEQGIQFPNVVLICQLPGTVPLGSLPSYRWCRMYTKSASPSDPLGGGGFTALKNEGGPYNLMGGSTSGALCHLEVDGRPIDDSQPIQLRWQSRFSDQGLPDNIKRYSDLEIDFQTAFGNESPASALSVYIVLDNGNKLFAGAISSATRTTVALPLWDFHGQDLRGKNASVRIEGNATSTCLIFAVYLHWYPEERTALTFDSGFTDLGIPERVKEVDYVELYATGIGQNLQKFISSDLPGSVLAHRDIENVTLQSGRATARTRLVAPVDGRNFRFLFAAPSTFQMHAARVRLRPIGEYIDGTIGEYFESPEFSVAPGRVGELKDFLLDYDVSGPGGQLLVYSDLPGTGLVIRRTLPIPFQNGRAPYIFPLEDSGDQLPLGQLFKVRLVPPAGGILRLHGRAVFRARIIGVYFNGLNGEVWETQPVDLFGGMSLYREVSIVAQTTAPMYFDFLTELPNEDMRVVATIPVNPFASTAGRLPIYGRLPGTLKGQLQKFRIRGFGIARIFEIKVYGRGLGTTETNWVWRDLPLERTPDEWQQIQMPVRATPEEFSWVDLAMDAIE